MKIANDKYYTPVSLAKQLIETTLSICSDIKSIIEPSAGNGSFSNILFDCYSDKYKIYAYDLYPEHESIIQQDYLQLNPNANDCLVIGNPPFGTKGFSYYYFMQHSVKFAKYIAFILPITQLDKDSKNLRLLNSIDLGLIEYSDRKLKCCFNIYKVDKLHKPEILKIDGLKIYSIRDGEKQFLNMTDYDINFCRIGASVGKIREKSNRITDFKIKIDRADKNQIIEFLNNHTWNISCISTPYLSKQAIIKELINYMSHLKHTSVESNDNIDYLFE